MSVSFFPLGLKDFPVSCLEDKSLAVDVLGADGRTGKGGAGTVLALSMH